MPPTDTTESTEVPETTATEEAPATEEAQEPDFDSLPEETKTEIRSLRRENQKLRRAVKDQQEAQAKADAKPPKTDEISSRYEEAMAQLRTAKVELAIRQQAGAQADALLDSRSFFREIEDLDPEGPTFESDLRAILKSHTKKAPQAAKSGADLAGGKTPEHREFSNPQQRLAAAYAASGTT